MCDVVKRIKEMGAKEGKAIGEAIGEARGEVNGRVKAYAEMVCFGDITLQKAAERLNMTEEEFQQAMQAIKSEKDGEERAE